MFLILEEQKPHFSLYLMLMYMVLHKNHNLISIITGLIQYQQQKSPMLPFGRNGLWSR